MKAIIAAPITASPTAEKTSLLSAYLDLIKIRLTALVLLTTLVGFYVGARGSVDYLLLLHTVLGTALVASGASALNQLLEKDLDALMRRTRTRPLPSGRLHPETALIFGGVTSCLGLVYLAMAVNLLTSVLGAITLVTYVF